MIRAATSEPVPSPDARTFSVYARDVGLGLAWVAAFWVLGPVSGLFSVEYGVAVSLVWGVASVIATSWFGGQVRIDPGARALTWRRGLLGRRPSKSWPFADIESVEPVRKGCSTVVEVQFADRAILVRTPLGASSPAVSWIQEVVRDDALAESP